MKQQEKLQQLLSASHFAEAKAQCLLLLRDNKSETKLVYFLALSCQGLNEYDEAMQHYDCYLKSHSSDFKAWQSLIYYLLQLKKHELALEKALKALSFLPNVAELCALVGYVYEKNLKIVDAYRMCHQALRLNPKEPLALTRTAVLLIKLDKLTLAKQFCETAIKVSPHLSELYDALSDVHMRFFSYASALDVINLAIERLPQNANLHLKKGLILACMAKFHEASYEINQAQALDSEVVRRSFKALESLNDEQIALNVNPLLIYLNASFSEQAQCYWANRTALLNCIRDYYLQDNMRIEQVVSADLVFQMLFLPLHAHERLSLARKFSSYLKQISPHNEMNEIQQLYEFKPPVMSGKRLKIGYLSPDFRNHAGGFLISKIFETHDKNHFEIFAYSLQKPLEQIDATYNRIANACEHFVDVSELTAQQVADKIYADAIDILVDLAGYTGKSHPQIAVMRPAPIQISYLGYVQSMGSQFIDYIMADAFVRTEALASDWDEKLIVLPNSLYVYDTDTTQLKTNKTRKDFGLPETAFVYCCLNGSYKIEPTIFDAWMEILKATPESVLWLMGANTAVESHLKKEAEIRGVEPLRLIFTTWMPHEEHLQRYQLADLFLDTYWCGGHTTALDALWQGLPVLACTGKVSSSRIASCFLQLLNLHTLIVDDLKAYIERAIELARNPLVLNQIKLELKRNLENADLFNSPLNVSYIEQAYQQVWNRHCKALLPDHIVVSASNHH